MLKLNILQHLEWEIISIAKVLWGIWFFRNKKAWENKDIRSSAAMDWSTKFFSDWKNAKNSRLVASAGTGRVSQPIIQRWIPPEVGKFKLNTDASFKNGSDYFSVGLVLRDHFGSFVAGSVMSLKGATTVLEAEVCAIKEGLLWLVSMSYQDVEVESDSLLAVQAIKQSHDIQL